MHDWSDKDFDWRGLSEAIDMIDSELRFWRINVHQSKEKFGTCRIYCTLGWHSLYDITHPGYAFYRYPKWLMQADINFFSKFVPLLNIFIYPLHKKVYRNAYKKAVDKFPHLIEEICCMADYVELLTFYKQRNSNEK